MKILAFFTDSGIPATGLSPTIRIRDLSDDSLVVTDAVMSEVGDGHYKYEFLTYDPNIDYAIRCDGGATLTGAERYTYAGNENYYEDIQDAVWTTPVTAYSGKNMTGAMQTILYGNAVYIDTVSGGASGVDFPTGTLRFPVDNFVDAVAIARTRGITNIIINDNLSIPAGTDATDLIFMTPGYMETYITIEAGASVDRSAFRYLNLQGEISNGDIVLVENCTIYNLANFSGVMNNVAMGEASEIILGTSSWAQIIHATAAGDAGNEPEISIGDSILNVSQLTGNLKLKDKTGTDRTVINSTSSFIIIDSTCVSGSIELIGTGGYEDNSGPNCQVETDAFISLITISDRVWDEQVSGHLTAGSFGSYNSRLQLRSVTVTGVSSNSKFATDLTEVTNDFWLSSIILWTSGNNKDLMRTVKKYDGSTKEITVGTGMPLAVQVGDTFIIWPQRRPLINEDDYDDIANAVWTHQISGGGVGRAENYLVNVDTNVIGASATLYNQLVTDIPGLVWDEELANHTTLGTFGNELATKADIQAATSTTETVATSGRTIFGTQTGTYVNTHIRDDVYWQIQESGTQGITVELAFNIPDGEKPGVIKTHGRYIGLPANLHHIELWAYNFEAGAWEELQETYLPGGQLGDADYTHEYYERNIDRTNNNNVRIQLIHNVTNYNASHIMYLDYVAVTSIDVITARDIAQAVWSENISGYTDELKFGGLVSLSLKRLLGLVHENIYIDNPIYDGDNNLTSARLRIYSTPSSVGTANDVIGTYEITSPGDGPGKFTTWSQIRQ